MDIPSNEELIKQRDEVLKALSDVIENYRYNQCNGIGMGPLVRATKLLDKYGMLNGGSKS